MIQHQNQCWIIKKIESVLNSSFETSLLPFTAKVLAKSREGFQLSCAFSLPFNSEYFCSNYQWSEKCLNTTNIPRDWTVLGTLQGRLNHVSELSNKLNVNSRILTDHMKTLMCLNSWLNYSEVFRGTPLPSLDSQCKMQMIYSIFSDSQLITATTRTPCLHPPHPFK